MTFGSLFSGIGGMDLGLERAGMKCVWQVEIDDSARRDLERHWPQVKRWDDVRTFPGKVSWEKPQLIAGGFPCQDISEANYKGRGLEGERSGLWFEFARVLRVFRPKYAIVENVAAITFRGLGRVLSDLSQMGFDAEWQTVPASALGAPHNRERLFIVAYRPSKRFQENEVFSRSALEASGPQQASRLQHWPGERQPSLSLPDRVRWCPHRKLCRVVNGVPDELDRYRKLGNAVVPQVAECIGRAIMQAERGGA